MMRAIAAKGERLQLLDAVRGLASLAVAAFHIYVFSAAGSILQKAIPRWLDVLLRHGSLGVDVFFVLSGLVIAMSIANDRITWRYIGRFAVRRSIRLDPPYWATLALATFLLILAKKPPTPARVLAHVVYVQVLAGYQNIVSQFWTLTYEVQFYLVLVLMMLVAQRTGRRIGWAIALGPFVLSLAIQLLRLDTHGWFISWWYAFAFGAATTAMLSNRLRMAYWLSVAAAVFAVGMATSSVDVLTVGVGGCAIGLLGRAGLLARWSGGKALQWLGRRSYSLYLIHFVGSTVAKTLGARITTPVQAGAVFLLAIALSLIVAELLYRLVEAPAHRLSRTVGLFARGRSRGALAGEGALA